MFPARKDSSRPARFGWAGPPVGLDVIDRRSLALVGAVLLGVSPAAAQSFDCARATHADEKTICARPGLSALDDEMAGLYRDIMARALMGVRGEVRDRQRAFLAERRACRADAACIRRLYRTRIRRLKRIKQSVGQGAAG